MYIELETSYRYPLSNTLYTQKNNAHLLKLSSLSVATKNKLQSYNDNICGGIWCLSSEDKEFAKSIEYNSAIHHLDMLCGEYVNVIKPYAKELIIQRMNELGFVYEKNDLINDIKFSSASDDFGSEDYYKKGYYHFQPSHSAEFIKIPFETAEQYACEIV